MATGMESDRGVKEMSIEAMKQALEAWDAYDGGTLDHPIAAAMEALRAAIEQAEKPVAWMTHSDDLMPLFHRTKEAALNWQTQPTPLYAAPRQWVGLTEIEICDIEAEELKSASSETFSFAMAIEAKLKEKNEKN